MYVPPWVLFGFLKPTDLKDKTLILRNIPPTFVLQSVAGFEPDIFRTPTQH